MNKIISKPQQRRSIRLKGYDYSNDGLYFITICCQDRICLFGNVVNGEMVLNDAGKTAEKCWLEIPEHFTNVVLHEFVIMPNHVHGIVEFVGANHYSPATNDHSPANGNEQTPVTANHDSLEIRANNDSQNTRANNDSPLREPKSRPHGTSKTIGSMVRGFKIGVTKWFRANTNVENVWQRNYWENIIRNDESYEKISTYIKKNPANWNDDKFNMR